MTENFMVNTIGTLKVINAVKARLNNLAKIVIITSKMGSISDNNSGGRYGYRMSKAALNAAAKSLAIDLKPQGISVSLIHPGWVKTDMGGPNALISTEESSSGIVSVIKKTNIKNSGLFYNFNGDIIDW